MKATMKPASFENSVDVLIKAYMNDTLDHGTCGACAVGNLVFEATGKETAWDRGWGSVFFTDPHSKNQFFKPREYYGNAKHEIDSTGYPLKSLMRIEYAFETARKGKCSDDWMFNGLMAVVDVLAEIHGVDLTVKEAAIGEFQKVHATK